MRDERLVENAAAMGEVLAAELPELADDHPSVGELRGLGLLWGLELVRDRETREPLVPYAAAGRPRSRWRPSGGPPWTAASTCTCTGTSCWSRRRSSSGATSSATGLGILDEVLAVADGLARA